MAKYAVGVDYGTESGRAVLVDVSNGRELATAIHPYANGVIDRVLPGTSLTLDHDFALQDPNDYLEVLKHTVPANDGQSERISISFNLMFKNFSETMAAPLWDATAGKNQG